MTGRPEGAEPVEAYRRCDLPIGTRYRRSPDRPTFTAREQDDDDDTLVMVVEWPQRTYDGIPADYLDSLLRFAAGYPTVAVEVDHIEIAIAAQEQGS